VVAAAAPVDAEAAVRDLAGALRSGATFERAPAPRRGNADPDLRRALETVDGSPLARERAAELLLECEIIDHLETPRLRELAAKRYVRGDQADATADRLAEEWLAADPETDGSRPVATDDPGDPDSLVSRLRAELSRRRIPFRVSLRRGMSPLAATMPGEIQVAAGRTTTLAAVLRTACHEVQGHAAPMHRAESEARAVFRHASAFGADEQEGFALTCEERGGHLAGLRRRELALRHVAARMVQAGGAAREVGAMLVARGADTVLAARIALRALRGGGLARECVYLPAYLRVRAASESVRAVLARGRVSVAAAGALLAGDASCA